MVETGVVLIFETEKDATQYREFLETGFHVTFPGILVSGNPYHYKCS
jgi:hypothetical protein